jgi:predicted Zn finger-like uncharacterized protein
MIIQCDKCGTRFKLDDSRVSGGGVKVRCTKCQNVFLVSPQAEAAPPVGAPEGMGAVQAGPVAGKPKGETANLKFDFERPEPPTPRKEPSAATPPAVQAKPSGGAVREGADTGLFGEKGFEITPPGGATAGEGVPSAGELGLDFRFDTDEEEAEAKTPVSKEAPSVPAPAAPPAPKERPDFSLDFKIEAEAAPAARAKEAPAAAPTPSGVMHRTTPGPSLDLFGKGMAKEEGEGGVEKAWEKEEPVEGVEGTLPEAPAPHVEERRKARSVSPGLIAIAVIIIGVAALYFTGVLSALKDRLTGPPASVAAALEIEDVKGFFADNKFAGRVFVIESRIKNATDEPRTIRRVKGTIYNSEGAAIASRDVSPGRVLSPDDIKNLPVEELQRQFKDPSGGLIPPKGTVPVTVLFIEAPGGIAEFGIDIVR